MILALCDDSGTMLQEILHNVDSMDLWDARLSCELGDDVRYAILKAQGKINEDETPTRRIRVLRRR